MELEAILNMANFRLPAENNSGKPFVGFVENLLKEYIHQVKSSAADFFSNLNLQLLSFPEYYQSIENYSATLVNIIRLVNKNQPDDAYAEFKKMMADAGPFVSNYPGAIHFTKPDDAFYRCKFLDKQPIISPKEYFFHTPFHLNHLTKSTRYSANGFPSMYLTNTMIVGYRETRAASLDNFQGVKIQSKLMQSFLDVDYNKPGPALKISDKNAYDLQLQVKGIIFPLLLCCYTQQNAGGAAAPQEYIIPQLLVRWVRDNSTMFAGIKYPSTRINSNHYRGDFYNLIVYPKDIRDEGYCEKLKQSYLMSEVCSATVHQKEINDFYMTEFVKVGSVNKQIQTVDWNLNPENYNINDVGKMEFYIKYKLPVDKINF